MKVLETRSLKKIYTTGEIEVRALDGVNLEIESGQFAAIVGTSGSGKSTLLNMLGGLDAPTAGAVLVKGVNIADMESEERTIFRRRNIGFVFQNFNLIPMLSAYENIVLPLKLDGTKIDRPFIEELISALGLEGKIHQMPDTLSGGQQQRVAIARALAAKPAIILADEPTGNLDSRTSMEVIELMRLAARRFHQTMVIVTHNEQIAQMADMTIRIEDGKIVEQKEPAGR